MKQRTTIMMDDAVLKKLRAIQAKKIQKENRSVSISEVINEIIRD